MDRRDARDHDLGGADMSGNLTVTNYIKVRLGPTDVRFVFFDDGNPFDLERAQREMARHCMGRLAADVASQFRESEIPVPVVGTNPRGEEKQQRESGYEALAGE